MHHILILGHSWVDHLKRYYEKDIPNAEVDFVCIPEAKLDKLYDVVLTEVRPDHTHLLLFGILTEVYKKRTLTGEESYRSEKYDVIQSNINFDRKVMEGKLDDIARRCHHLNSNMKLIVMIPPWIDPVYYNEQILAKAPSSVLRLYKSIPELSSEKLYSFVTYINRNLYALKHHLQGENKYYFLGREVALSVKNSKPALNRFLKKKMLSMGEEGYLPDGLNPGKEFSSKLWEKISKELRSGNNFTPQVAAVHSRRDNHSFSTKRTHQRYSSVSKDHEIQLEDEFEVVSVASSPNNDWVPLQPSQNTTHSQDRISRRKSNTNEQSRNTSICTYDQSRSPNPVPSTRYHKQSTNNNSSNFSSEQSRSHRPKSYFSERYRSRSPGVHTYKRSRNQSPMGYAHKQSRSPPRKRYDHEQSKSKAPRGYGRNKSKSPSPMGYNHQQSKPLVLGRFVHNQSKTPPPAPAAYYDPEQSKSLAPRGYAGNQCTSPPPMDYDQGQSKSLASMDYAHNQSRNPAPMGYDQGQSKSLAPMDYAHNQSRNPPPTGYDPEQSKSLAPRGYAGNQSRSPAPIGYDQGQSKSLAPMDYAHNQSRNPAPMGYSQGQSKSLAPMDYAHNQSRNPPPVGYDQVQFKSLTPRNYDRDQSRSPPPMGYNQGQLQSLAPTDYGHNQSRSSPPMGYNQGQFKSLAPRDYSHSQSRSSSPMGYGHGQSPNVDPVPYHSSRNNNFRQEGPNVTENQNLLTGDTALARPLSPHYLDNFLLNELDRLVSYVIGYKAGRREETSRQDVLSALRVLIDKKLNPS